MIVSNPGRFQEFWVLRIFAQFCVACGVELILTFPGTTGHWILVVVLVLVGAGAGGLCGWYSPESDFVDAVCGMHPG